MQLHRGDGDNPSMKPGDLNVLMTLSGSLTRPPLTQSRAGTKKYREQVFISLPASYSQ